VNFGEYVFGLVGKAFHEHFASLSVNVLGAFRVVFLLDVGVLFSQTLTIQVLLRISCLVRHHFEGHHNGFVASVFASVHGANCLLLLRALVQTESVALVNHALCSLFKVSKCLPIKSLLCIHF
jgi:hypothetical protein